MAIRARAQHGLAQTLERGGGKETGIRAIAWLTLAASLVLAVVLIGNGPTIAVPYSDPGINSLLGPKQEASPLTIGFAIATAFSGAISFMLLKFAEMAERSALVVAYLAEARHRKPV